MSKRANEKKSRQTQGQFTTKKNNPDKIARPMRHKEAKATYQLFNPLRPEEYSALETDILKRGVQVPVEKDDDGNVLDGHHRQEIAEKHGLPCPEMVRHFDTEADKREHVIKLNLARRHLTSLQKGQAFEQLCLLRGVEFGKGKRNDKATSANLAEVAHEVGAPLNTCDKWLRQHRAYKRLPAAQRKAVDRKRKTVTQAKREVKEEEQEARREANRAHQPPRNAIKVIGWYETSPSERRTLQATSETNPRG